MNEAQQAEGMGTPPKARRSGTERRQKGRIVPFRVSADEYAKLDALAEREGLSIGSYVRSCVFTTPSTSPTTRAIRRPVVEVELLRSYLNELHKIGSNINQTAKRVNMGDTTSSPKMGVPGDSEGWSQKRGRILRQAPHESGG